MLLTRRAVLVGSSALIYSCAVPAAQPSDLHAALAAIEARSGGRLGVHALDTATGRRIGFHDDARFAMASTFKLVLAANILRRVDAGLLTLEQRVRFDASDMLPHAPATSLHLAEGSMSVEQLCAAIIVLSDNPAANLLLKLIGGPAEITRFARSLQDDVTRLDRNEPTLNTNEPGDARDTTSPRAMVGLMRQLLTVSALSVASRAKLIAWMTQSQTGAKRIRAGLPTGWRAGDKTGTGANGAVNDVAIAWPPHGGPILIAIYLSESKQGADELSAAHAEVARVIAQAFA